MILKLIAKEVAKTKDVQRIVLETSAPDREAIIEARKKKIKGLGPGPQPTPGMALVLPLESALQAEPGDTVTVTVEIGE